MKLLNREPTEEMCIAAREKTGISANAAAHIFMIMFDAAPHLDHDTAKRKEVLMRASEDPQVWQY